MSWKTDLEFTYLQCIHCGTLFFMQSNLLGIMRAQHREFHCPSGHAQHFDARDPVAQNSELKNEITNLKIDNARLSHKLEQLEAKQQEVKP